jgi:hypothetical protein
MALCFDWVILVGKQEGNMPTEVEEGLFPNILTTFMEREGRD